MAANCRAQSDWSHARLLRVTLPNTGTQTFFAEDVENNRSDTIGLVDLRVGKRIRFGGGTASA